ncbi:MAG: selenocysteine-specific translation elongation factor [SAR324 cluster bacterium]|nr:selenocysteine-specific translation elongation factor [SAR324 cluster bacterium]
MASDTDISGYYVIGTGGHIDHGKTTLVKALTGTDTDVLAEEKRRGITIDLGFAHYQDALGTRFAFIDVPGHEKFIHNMLAGVSGIDALLLVVACDEGVMPQTREHLAICDLLGVRQGLIVLTRSDLADPEMRDLCAEEVRETVKDTFLEAAPMVPVSAKTGEGLEALKTQLEKLYKKLTPRHVDHPFRMNVDRSFSVKGFGTVVTGTVVSGRVRKEVPLTQFPSGQIVRVRGFQVHGQSQDEIRAGQRAALNISNLSRDEIQRGDQLATEGTLLTSYMLNAELRILKDIPAGVAHNTRVRVYLGTAEVMGKLVLFDRDLINPGERSLVQLRLEKQVSSRTGDRFIIRNFNAQFTIGGGKVIDPFPGKSRRIRQAQTDKMRLLVHGSDEEIGETVVYLQSIQGVTEKDFMVRSGLSSRRADGILQKLRSSQKIIGITTEATRYIHVEHLHKMAEFLVRVIAAHHQKHPDLAGMTAVEIGGKVSLLFKDTREVESVLKYLTRQNRLAQQDQYFALPDHTIQISDDYEDQLARCTTLLEADQFQPRRQTQLLQDLAMAEKQGVAFLKKATHQKQLVRVSPDLFYTSGQMEAIVARLEHYFSTHETISVIEFKEFLNIGRKHAVELLEYFDTRRLTIRRDNHRVWGSQTKS